MFRVNICLQILLYILTIYKLAITYSGTTALSKTPNIWLPAETHSPGLKICSLLNYTSQTTFSFILFIAPYSHTGIPVSFKSTTSYPAWLSQRKINYSIFYRDIYQRSEEERNCVAKKRYNYKSSREDIKRVLSSYYFGLICLLRCLNSYQNFWFFVQEKKHFRVFVQSHLPDPSRAWILTSPLVASLLSQQQQILSDLTSSIHINKHRMHVG